MSVRRGNLRDRLDRILNLDDGETFQLMEEIDRDVDRSFGFRWSAPATQARQDYHLCMYFQFVKFVLQKPRDTPDAVLKVEGFPKDFNLLGRLLQRFLIYVFQNAVPRSRAIGETISYATLAQYRDSMLFWVRRIFNERGLEQPQRSKLFNEMTEAIRYVQAKYGKNTPKPRKSAVGLAELRQLIDHEMYHNICIEKSEQHQVAWCIARITAVRPGSIGPSKKGRNEPLKWKDVSFIVGDVPGQFDVTITFPNIAIKEPGAIGPGQATEPRPFRVTIRSPTNADGLIFSVPHRLLVIAIRRGILDGGISSIDDLMNTRLLHLRARNEYQDDPLFFQSVPKGTRLDPPHPLSAAQMTDYLASRGLVLGYNQPITFYSLRRKAATDLTRRIGPDAARIIMGHDPDTRTLERHYLDILPLTDVSAIQTEQEIRPGGIVADLDEAASLAVNQLSNAARAKTNGLALKAYTKMLIQLDPDAPPTNPEELKQYRKLMARRAKKQLIAKEAELQARNMTQEDFRGRKGALNASEFVKSLLENAQAALAESPSTWDNAEGDEEDIDANIDSLFEEEQEEQEEDVEDAIAHGTIGESLFVEQEEEESDLLRSSDQASPTLQFKDLAASFMNLLMENSLTTYTGPWQSDNATCPMCEDDTTASAQDKAKAWNSKSNLERHMESTFHSPRRRWERRMKQLHRQNAPWLCPYCTKSKEYPDLGEMERHIRKSRLNPSDPESVQHERLKTEDGWFELDWEGHISKERERSRERAIQRNTQAIGITFVNDPPELPESIPAPGHPGIMLGGPTLEVPAWALVDAELVDEPREPGIIPPHLEGVIELVDIDDIRPTEIPPHMKHLIEFVDIPDSQPDSKRSKR